MLFNRFMRDRLTIIKKNGDKIENIKALIQAEKAFINRIDIDIEEGDSIERSLPTGRIEKYIVEESTLYNASKILAHYELTLKKIIS